LRWYRIQNIWIPCSHRNEFTDDRNSFHQLFLNKLSSISVQPSFWSTFTWSDFQEAASINSQYRT
jgi:hypothetical protein